jgi:hypothetical protein
MVTRWVPQVPQALGTLGTTGSCGRSILMIAAGSKIPRYQTFLVSAPELFSHCVLQKGAVPPILEGTAPL